MGKVLDVIADDIRSPYVVGIARGVGTPFFLSTGLGSWSKDKKRGEGDFSLEDKAALEGFGVYEQNRALDDLGDRSEKRFASHSVAGLCTAIGLFSYSVGAQDGRVLAALALTNIADYAFSVYRRSRE